MAATNGNAASPAADSPAAVLDDMKPPPGVVLPPREIRQILEKTAGYVARNGAVFEDRIRERESANPRFSFLSSDDAYHPFYRWRVDEIKAGRGTAIAAGRAGETATPTTEKPAGPPKPPDFEFSARMPRLNQKDLDVVRLTALFVAKNGRQFMTQLAQREAGNPQFAFLIPNHTFHNFFQHLVDQYTALLRACGLDGEGGKQQDERVAELQRNIDDRYRVLERARQRAVYTKYMDAERQKKEEEEEEHKAEFARVDWSDFVVVETITFSDADETANLPPPTNLSELQYASLEDRNKASISRLRIEEAFPGEEEELQRQQQQQQQKQYPQNNGYNVSQPLPMQPQAYPQPQFQRPEEAEEEQRRIQERADAQARMQHAHAQAQGGGAPMKIRENYVPLASQKMSGKANVQMALCPNCKQQIPMDELEAHMRIELLDPSWKEQKAKAESRYAYSNVTHADVANNLKRLASQRSDVFDPITGQAISEEELARRKKAALQGGNATSGADGVNMNVEPHVDVNGQIRAIHQKFNERR